MRALTKAITRMSEHGSDPLDTIIQSIANTNEPEVAVVVGLGGGTGSGILIDLVERIGEAGANVTLFGILPNPSGDDGADVLANAYATLSELEYLALTDAGLFRNRILLPYDPAVSDDNFDKAACYTISSFYNIHEYQSNTYKDFDENTDNGPPAFAPFTIGSTRYLHYLKEDYDQIEEKFRKFFDIKRDHVDIESDLYDKIESFIESNYNPESDYLRSTAASPEDAKLSNEKALDLRDRLNRIEDLLNEPFMKEIGFFSPAKLAKTVSDVKDDSKGAVSWDNERNKAAAVARDLIPRLADAVNPNNVTEFEPADEGWNSGEREFIKKVIEEFELIARRWNCTGSQSY
ncbi:tubulin-like doman-containing protein [Halonotius sp. GCM10025705]|uniref:tubulin-like doman-containing protein n=1 Tax=Halonotius sp. GCM10025705 TaxID=3252678 RepID=UPI0036088342